MGGKDAAFAGALPSSCTSVRVHGPRGDVLRNCRLKCQRCVTRLLPNRAGDFLGGNGGWWEGG